MNEALHCVYQSVKPRLPEGYAFADFARAFDSWRVIALERVGKTIGGVLISGNDIHVGYSSPPGASMRAHIRKTINALIAEHGHVITKVAKDNAAGVRFCRRMGFSVTNETGDMFIMRCDRSNYE